ncbi:receptor-type tyrosine-protein phosphatase T-like [Watersipora subatra]|uniref:receptor-type tyrosine-protein phosphatase T-like n=1 Tax=Watersipora subatra TaxID=2589382 RepID=UPI00355C61E4
MHSDYRSADQYLLISTNQSPGDPSLSSIQWTQIDYRAAAFTATYNKKFDTPLELQHLAVYSQLKNSSLTLAEVEVYEYNYAMSKVTDQSSNVNNAGRAFDGDLNSRSGTMKKAGPWWRVDLGQNIIFKEVLVYVRNGTCSGEQCDNLLREVYFLTNKRHPSGAPSTEGANGWSICSNSRFALGAKYTIICDTGIINPLTRLFSIYSSATTRIELREAEVYGHELPQLNSDIDTKIDNLTSSSFTVSILQWNQTMPGGLPPTNYIVTLSTTEEPKVLSHNPELSRISLEFDGLSAGETYTLTISCSIQGENCPGNQQTLTSTTLCKPPSVPQNPKLSAVNITNDGRQRWKYTATWQGQLECQTRDDKHRSTEETINVFREKNPALDEPTGPTLLTNPQVPNNINCNEKPEYKYNITPGYGSSWQKELTSLFYLDGDVPYTFRVRARNRGGSSDWLVTTGRSDALSPQFVSDDIHVIATNSSCVTVSWSNPTYSGGNISSYETIIINCDSLTQLRYKINNENFQANSAFNDLKPVTTYNFTVKTTNDKGFVSFQSHTITTGEAKPDKPSKLTHVEDTPCVTIMWEEPLTSNGFITNYSHLCHKFENDNQNKEWTQTKDNEAVYCDYDAGDRVQCRVKASTSIGTGPRALVDLQMPCGSPESPKFNVTPFQNSSASLNISFEESTPYCDSITHYVITVSRDGSLLYNDTTETHGIIIINDLKGFTSYSVILTAVNNANLKKESIQYVLTSETDPPGKPNIIAIQSTSDSVSINVTQPEVPNGIIKRYFLSCYTGQEKLVMQSDGNAFGHFSGLPSATKISCSAKAENSVGPGNATTAYSYTQLKLKNAGNMQPTINQPPKKVKLPTVTITIRPVLLENVEVSDYLVMLSEQSREKRSSTEVACPQVSAKNCYVAKTIPASEIGSGYKFIAGDGSDGNPSLNFGATYDVYLAVRVFVEEGYEPLIMVLEPQTVTADGVQANDEMLYENPTRSEDRTKVIAVDELEFHIKTHIELIEEQYKLELHKLPAPTMNVALTAENKGKCRYKGLYPSDKYRVCLERTDPNESDFINASIMKGYGREAQYIAAQGPFTDAVVNDFWLMIWQQQPSAIVMVTRAIEQTKMKCKQYWPLHKGHVKVFGDFQVELKASETYSDFAMSQLKVTLEQYVLLHHVLYESLETEKFICQPYDLETKIQAHLQQKDERKDVITLEFEHAMKRTASHCLSYDTAKLPINQDKSRFSEILPPDSSMPYLKNYSKGNFVNAVLVDGYKEKKQWIASQLPLSITTPDFWQLILELEISVIVQLETSPNAFYPMKDETAIEEEPFLIKRFTSADREGVKLINVSFEKEGLEDAKHVQVIVLKNWTSVTLPTTNMILSLQREVETAQQKVPNGKICVTCLDGSTKCGIFICAYNAIEKLKTEQMVDIYYSTIMAKLRRPQFIPTMEQYIFLYQVLKDYMNAFGEYANFT